MPTLPQNHEYASKIRDTWSAAHLKPFGGTLKESFGMGFDDMRRLVSERKPLAWMYILSQNSPVCARSLIFYRAIRGVRASGPLFFRVVVGVTFPMKEVDCLYSV